MTAVEVYDCGRRANTVAAIKHIRQVCRLGLAEAKRLIDEVYCGGRSISLKFATDAEAEAFADFLKSLGFECRLAVAGQPGDTVPDAGPG